MEGEGFGWNGEEEKRQLTRVRIPATAGQNVGPINVRRRPETPKAFGLEAAHEFQAYRVATNPFGGKCYRRIQKRRGKAQRVEAVSMNREPHCLSRKAFSAVGCHRKHSLRRVAC